VQRYNIGRRFWFQVGLLIWEICRSQVLRCGRRGICRARVERCRSISCICLGLGGFLSRLCLPTTKSQYLNQGRGDQAPVTVLPALSLPLTDLPSRQNFPKRSRRGILWTTNGPARLSGLGIQNILVVELVHVPV
jgi:hypothetical protein